MSDWIDITGSFEEREKYLNLASEGKAVIRRLKNGWFAKLKPISAQRGAHEARSQRESGEPEPTENTGQKRKTNK